MKEQIVYKKVSELKLNTKNPRKNDDAVDTVAKSIQEFGFKNPLIIDKNGVVWCGNTRLKASKKLGLEEVPLTEEEKELSRIAHTIYDLYTYDGKYILDKDRLIVCQSNAKNEALKDICKGWGYDAIVNPLGEWTGGTDVDSGATNRKLGSDMAQSVTGGGLHGKDLSKADVSVNIYAFIKAQVTREPVELCCAIGDDEIDGKPYSEIVEIARKYIKECGGFEKFAEWGLY